MTESNSRWSSSAAEQVNITHRVGKEADFLRQPHPLGSMYSVEQRYYRTPATTAYSPAPSYHPHAHSRPRARSRNAVDQRPETRPAHHLTFCRTPWISPFQSHLTRTPSRSPPAALRRRRTSTSKAPTTNPSPSPPPLSTQALPSTPRRELRLQKRSPRSRKRTPSS